jgi:hypothetical protein
MKRLTLTLSAMALVAWVAGCGSTQSATPPPQKAGWTIPAVEEVVTVAEKDGRTPTQAKCEAAAVAERVTPSELAVLSHAAGEHLSAEAKTACGVQ